LTKEDFSAFSRHLHSFLRSRLSGFNAEANLVSDGSSARPLGAPWIRQVQSSTVAMPAHDVATSNTPSPWAIEVEVQGYSSPGAAREAGRAYAHFVFLSSKRHCTPTHYPVLLWKAPPAAIFNNGNGVEEIVQNGISINAGSRLNEDPNSLTQSLTTARLLVSHVLEFIERYFDCRISQQKPMCSIRGPALQRLADAIVDDLQKVADDHDLSAEAFSLQNHPLDLGYAVPAYLHDGDVPQTADSYGARTAALAVVEGPAPMLNLITLTVPVAVVSSYLQSEDSGSSLVSAVQDYLAEHTSLMPQNLTLVRIGIAGVFIGSPTTTSLIASGQRGQTNGEVRLKLNAIQQLRQRGRDRKQHSPFEAARIAGILRELVKIAEEDDW
jgi:hypothetical protein